jgi:deoxycytidine triphosphate deaminase/outer membrane murein-binding lipoprotein Lpp
MDSASRDPPRLPEFPTTDADADVRFSRYRHVDPFPDIEPALLNSADLLDYVSTVGMLSPYTISPESREIWLKPASCAVPCTGDVLRFGFDRERGRVTKTEEYTLSDEHRLYLPANSITFLQLGTTFRFPDYIAGRFNLAIREIHRGLLVGTGPLVDPGFVGRLFIPLHNLTSNEYSIAYGEPLVWLELTKLSPNRDWVGEATEPRVADYIPFAERKLKRKSPAHYLDHANEGKPIASSIPQEVERAKIIAEEAGSSVRRLRNFGIGAALLGALGVLYPAINLVSDTNSRVDQWSTDRQELNRQLDDLRRIDQAQAAQIKLLESRTKPTGHK